MKTVAVIGSSSGDAKAIPLAEKLGAELARHGVAVITGACGGLPMAAALGAKKQGGTVIGFSPASNAYEHTRKYDYPLKPFDFIVYTGFGYKGRNVPLVRSADAVAVVGGRMGTLNEFTIAYDEGKLIGILEGSGGLSDRARSIEELATRKTGAKVIYSRSPEWLAEKLASSVK